VQCFFDWEERRSTITASISQHKHKLSLLPALWYQIAAATAAATAAAAAVWHSGDSNDGANN
jgi:hypothetical protein